MVTGNGKDEAGERGPSCQGRKSCQLLPLDDIRDVDKMAANLRSHQTTKVTLQPSEKDHWLCLRLLT